MTNARVITLTPGAIQRNLIKINRIINELDYYKRGIGKSNQRRMLERNNSYLKQILDKADVKLGVPCFKCGLMISPGSYCVAKYHHNNLIPIAIHYHTHCWAELYH